MQPVGSSWRGTRARLFGLGGVGALWLLTGRTAEMTYYEHPSGGRVFSAGALDFGGQALLWPQTAQLLQNVWHRLLPGS